MTNKRRAAVIQFTLGGLFLAITWLAIICKGLITLTGFWAETAASLTMLALFTAVSDPGRVRRPACCGRFQLT
jgi:hypothetical protein